MAAAIDDLLVAVLDAARAMNASRVAARIDRDDAGFAQFGSIEIVRDGVILEVIALSADIVELALGRVIELSEITEALVLRGSTSPLSLALHRGALALAHPEDTQDAVFQIDLDLDTWHDDESFDEDRIARLIDAIDVSQAADWDEPDGHGPSAANDLEVILQIMLFNGAREAVVYNNGRVHAPDSATPIHQLIASWSAFSEFIMGLRRRVGGWHVSPETPLNAYGMRLRLLVRANDLGNQFYDEGWLEIRRVDPADDRVWAPTRHTVGDALLSKICDEPADRGAELVYADWLMEHGDPRGSMLVDEQLLQLPPARWCPRLAALGTVAPLDGNLLAAIVDAPSLPTHDWETCVAERHWQLVDSLWFGQTAPRSICSHVLERAPLVRLRHLALPHDELAASLAQTPAAEGIETLTLTDGRYNPRIEGLNHVLDRGAFPRLRCCVIVVPPDGSRAYVKPWGVLGAGGRDIPTHVMHTSTEQPFDVLSQTRALSTSV